MQFACNPQSGVPALRLSRAIPIRRRKSKAAQHHIFYPCHKHIRGFFSSLERLRMRSLLEVDQSRPLWSYIQIARVDHWFKNVFMLFGVLLAFFYEPALFTWTGILQVLYALFATCLIASSNYVINELLDAPSD